jgi:Electron transfer DM13
MTIRLQQQPPDAPLHPRSYHHKRPTIRTLLLTVGLLVLVGAGGIAWWLFSPLFFHNTSNDTNPFAHASSTASTPASSSPSGNVSPPVPTGPVILATGKFIDKVNSGVGLANDHGSGNVTIGKTADGTYLIHLDHLNVTNGPDLHVYLAPTTNSTDAGQVKSEGVDLGVLKATQGSVNVTLPPDIGRNLRKYHSVVIVCKAFSVIFTTAPLTFTSGS